LREKVVAKRNVRGQREVTARYWESLGVVYGGIEGELNTFNEVESNGVFEATVVALAIVTFTTCIETLT